MLYFTRYDNIFIVATKSFSALKYFHWTLTFFQLIVPFSKQTTSYAIHKIINFMFSSLLEKSARIICSVKLFKSLIFAANNGLLFCCSHCGLRTFNKPSSTLQSEMNPQKNQLQSLENSPSTFAWTLGTLNALDFIKFPRRLKACSSNITNTKHYSCDPVTM